LRALQDALRCLGRQEVLLALASNAAGRIHVGGLAEQLGIDQKTLSHHLKDLRTAGLVFDQTEGKPTYYQVVPGLVRYERQGDLFSLIVTARASRVSITITVPVTAA
jgi:DNA-binding transcriptional ArsR family regulator